MKANELRIGNYVNYQQWRTYKQGTIRTINNGSCNIASLGDSSPIDTIKFKMIEPALLTEEWLLKFGFGKVSRFDSIAFEKRNLIVEWLFEKWTGRLYLDYKESVQIITVKYVHQLQNLYFALTGEELTQKS